jgi:hypothetical protein
MTTSTRAGWGDPNRPGRLKQLEADRAKTKPEPREAEPEKESS